MGAEHNYRIVVGIFIITASFTDLTEAVGTVEISCRDILASYLEEKAFKPSASTTDALVSSQELSNAKIIIVLFPCPYRLCDIPPIHFN